MLNTKESGAFGKWMKNLRDPLARHRIYSRIKRLAKGNPGDVKPVGEGISEMRIFYGPGYRVYYEQPRGGTKSTQGEDIKQAKKIAMEYKI